MIDAEEERLRALVQRMVSSSQHPLLQFEVRPIPFVAGTSGYVRCTSRYQADKVVTEACAMTDTSRDQWEIVVIR